MNALGCFVGYTIRGCASGQDLLSSAAPVGGEVMTLDVSITSSKPSPTVAASAHSAASPVDSSASNPGAVLKVPRMNLGLEAVSALVMELEIGLPYTEPPTTTATTVVPPPAAAESACNPHSSMFFASRVVCCNHW